MVVASSPQASALGLDAPRQGAVRLTKIIIEDGLTIGGKSIKEHYEVLGHSDAYTYLFTLAKTNEIRESNNNHSSHFA